MTIGVYHFLVLLGTIIFCFGLKYILAKPFYQLSSRSVTQLDIIMDADTDEDEKDSLILKNLLGLLKMFFLVLLLLILLVFLAMIPALLYLRFNPQVEADTSSWYFYGSMFLGSFVILFFKEKSDYSYWSKLLHTIILDNYNVGKYFFKRDVKKLDQTSSEKEPIFVIVSGLARAGTTALTRMIYDPKVFHSTKYSNMPFIMAPKFWKRFYNPKNAKAKQRAHGDNVMHSETSVEAMEEYYFKVQLKDAFINNKSLDVHEISETVYQDYLKFQELFKEEGSNTIFLAKNNNQVLRYKSLRNFNKNFKMLLLFRNPMDHARSLLNQHLNFIKQQKDDPFTLKYMNWLGHHEFGLNQKFFRLGIDLSLYDKKEMSFWLYSWLNYYEYILEFFPDENSILIDYRDLLEKPNELKKKLASELSVRIELETEKTFSAAKYKNQLKPTEISDELHQRLTDTYELLRSKRLIVE